MLQPQKGLSQTRSGEAFPPRAVGRGPGMAEAPSSLGTVRPFSAWFLVQLWGPRLCLSLRSLPTHSPSVLGAALGILLSAPEVMPFAGLISDFCDSQGTEQLVTIDNWQRAHCSSSNGLGEPCNLCPLYTILPFSVFLLRYKVLRSPAVKEFAYLGSTSSPNLFD